MTENLPDEELNVVGDEQETPIDSIAPEAYDPVLEGQPDSYAGAAEDNPDRWQEDPLLQDEPGVDSLVDENSVPVVGEEGILSDQTLREQTAGARYESGDEQIMPEEPRMGEAAADVDFGMMEDDEVDASDDPANRGGSPISGIDVDDVR